MDTDKLPPFLRKTWDIVEDAATDHIVKWSTSGRSFVVLDVEMFSKEILPRFFKHSNWSSFVRQLNTYGFRKIDPDRWEFANDNFTKGGKGLLNVIQRRKPTITSTLTAIAAQTKLPETPHSFYPGAGPSSQTPAPAPDYMQSHMYPAEQQGLGIPLYHTQASAAQGGSAAGFRNIATLNDRVTPQFAQPAATMGRMPSTGDLTGQDGVDRMNALVEQYLRPGQRLMSTMHPESHSTSSGDPTNSGGVSGSTEADDAADDSRVKHSKRARAIGSGCSTATAEAGPLHQYLDKDGIPLPAGITRPLAQSAGINTQSLLTEMAGQIGRLSHLAGEMEDLRQDNVTIRRGLDAMYSKGQLSEPMLQALIQQQQDRTWQLKLKNDNVELQMAAQYHAQAAARERSALIEAQMAHQCKLSLDTVEMTRTMEAANKELASKLALQHSINQQQLESNRALEARVIELEQKLTGRHEEMMKGLEDRLMLSLSGMMSSKQQQQAASSSLNSRPQPEVTPDATTTPVPAQPTRYGAESSAASPKDAPQS